MWLILLLFLICTVLFWTESQRRIQTIQLKKSLCLQFPRALCFPRDVPASVQFQGTLKNLGLLEEAAIFNDPLYQVTAYCATNPLLSPDCSSKAFPSVSLINVGYGSSFHEGILYVFLGENGIDGVIKLNKPTYTRTLGEFNAVITGDTTVLRSITGYEIIAGARGDPTVPLYAERLVNDSLVFRLTPL